MVPYQYNSDSDDYNITIDNNSSIRNVVKWIQYNGHYYKGNIYKIWKSHQDTNIPFCIKQGSTGKHEDIIIVELYDTEYCVKKLIKTISYCKKGYNIHNNYNHKIIINKEEIGCITILYK
jgi:hypothetical protein